VPLNRFPFRLLGILLLGYFIYVADLSVVAAQMRNIGGASILSAAAAFVGLVLARCWRWHVLVTSIGVPTRAIDDFLSCNSSIWLGLVTPGRAGEFSRAVDLSRRSGRGFAEAGALVLFDLMLDLFVYVTLAVAGVIVLVLRAAQAAGFIYAIAIVVGLLCLANARPAISATIRWIPWLNKVPGVRSLLPSLESHLVGASNWKIAASTACASFAYALMIAILIAPLGLQFGFVVILAMVGLVGVSGALPITYFGVGTRDATLIWYLGHHGQSLETAVAVSFLFLLAQLVGAFTSFALGFAAGRLAPLLRR
jgi:hypothetical protein